MAPISILPPYYDIHQPPSEPRRPRIPPSPPAGKFHVARGGCWASPASECASAYRNGKGEVNEQTDYLYPASRIVCQIRARAAAASNDQGPMANKGPRAKSQGWSFTVPELPEGWPLDLGHSLLLAPRIDYNWLT